MDIDFWHSIFLEQSSDLMSKEEHEKGGEQEANAVGNHCTNFGQEVAKLLTARSFFSDWRSINLINYVSLVFVILSIILWYFKMVNFFCVYLFNLAILFILLGWFTRRLIFIYNSDWNFWVGRSEQIFVFALFKILVLHLLPI